MEADAERARSEEAKELPDDAAEDGAAEEDATEGEEELTEADDAVEEDGETVADHPAGGAEVIPLAAAKGSLVWGAPGTQAGGASQAAGAPHATPGGGISGGASQAAGAPHATPGGWTERQFTVDKLRELAKEIKPRDKPSAGVLRLLADAVEKSRVEEARAYVATLDPEGIAERMFRAGSIWGKLEVARAALIFAPICVTWLGLFMGVSAYASFVSLGTADAGRPFLYLWERGFPGVGVPLTFSGVAAIDSVLIGILIALSAVIHFGSDVRSPAREAEASDMVSRMRGILALAAGLSAASDMTPGEADALLDEYVAEEKRIYDRALEREQQLFDLSAVVLDLRQGAAALENFGESTSAAVDRIATSQNQLLAKIEAMSEREGVLASTISGLATTIGDAAQGSGVIVGSASSALQVIAESQKRILAQAEQLLKVLDGVDKAQQHATTTVMTQVDGMKKAADALEKGAQRIEAAAKTLSAVSFSASAPAVHAGGNRPLTAIAGATLALLLLLGGFALFDRLYEPDSRVFLREARSQIVPLQKVQSLRVTVMSQPVPGDRRDLGASVVDVLVAASRAERWLAQRAVPAGSEHIAANVRVAAQASRRAALSLAKWIEPPRADPNDPPLAGVLADLALADELLRDLTMQLALAGGR